MRIVYKWFRDWPFGYWWLYLVVFRPMTKARVSTFQLQIASPNHPIGGANLATNEQYMLTT